MPGTLPIELLDFLVELLPVVVLLEEKAESVRCLKNDRIKR